MEPIKLIYDGYEIEIRSGGKNEMPIVKMQKMVSNSHEEKTYLPKPQDITYPTDWYKQAPAWWENPPMWYVDRPSVTMPNNNVVLTNSEATSDKWGDPSGKYTEMGE